MEKASKKEECCAEGETESVCRVESLVSVDERGQMVLPKEFRERAGIRAGDKLVLVSWTREGQVCCMSLIKAEEMVDMVKDKLGPLMAEVL